LDEGVVLGVDAVHGDGHAEAFGPGAVAVAAEVVDAAD
jgi:hypothetical protein